jgi:hypothetical protein
MIVPKILKDSPHWVLPQGKDPIGISGDTSGWDNPTSWKSYDGIIAAYGQAKDRYDGIGYVVKAEEAGTRQIIGISLDYCRDPVTGKVSSWAEYILRHLYSPSSVNISGTGFFIFCLGSLPNGLTKITGSGPDDLSSEAKDGIITSEPDVAIEAESGEPAFNLFEIHQGGPQFFAITDSWLVESPLVLVDRTKELEEIWRLWTPVAFEESKEHGQAVDLPHLDILRVIDTSGFTKVGDELVGIHPCLPDQDCTYIKVNPVGNSWCFYQGRKLISGDSWLWLARESGALDWGEIKSDVLQNANNVQKVKEYAISKGYFTEDELFPEQKRIKDALKTVTDLKEKVLSDPGLPFEPNNLEALAILKINNMAEYQRTKSYWKNKVSIRDLNKAVDAKVNEIRVSNILNEMDGASSSNGNDSEEYLPDPSKNVATQIVDIIIEATEGLGELWRISNRNCYVSICCKDGHIEHHHLRAYFTKQWMSHLYYDKVGRVPNSSALNDAITVLEGIATNQKCYNTYVRVGEADGAIYIDLGDETYGAVKITASDWDIVQNPPIKFLRPEGLNPLPLPERGGSIDDLQSLLNIKDRKQWLLVKGWLIGTLSPRGPFPILAVGGEQGSAKTCLSKILRSMIDPNILPVRRPPKNTDDLMIAANNGWIVTFENISKITDRMSDDLCTLATGGGISKRKLYSNANETIIRACRPMIMNGIEDFITRQDLLDRSIVLALPAIPKENRRPEAEIVKDIKHLRPKILGALFDAAVVGLQRKDTLELGELPRMADFAKWAVAALGDEGKEFLEEYKLNRDQAVADALEGQPIFVALAGFIEREKGHWSGTATKLLSLLNAGSDYISRKAKGWPSAANALSGTLRRLTPALHTVGIDVEFSRDEKAKRRIITIKKVEVTE